jgi:DNA-binding GntR family transcriptional regulator
MSDAVNESQRIVDGSKTMNSEDWLGSELTGDNFEDREARIEQSMQSFLATLDGTEETRLPQRAYLAIQHAICYLDLPPGMKVLEREMTRILQMSRTPVREALVRLEVEGWIRLVPRHGLIVSPIEPEPLREIFEVTAGLDGIAGTFAAERATSDELDELHRVVDEQDWALRNGELLKWAKLDDQFHNLIIDMAHNERLKSIMNTLSDQVYRARLYTIERRAKPQRSIEEHRVIAATLKAKEADAARILLQSHRRRGSDEVIDILRREAESKSNPAKR